MELLTISVIILYIYKRNDKKDGYIKIDYNNHDNNNHDNNNELINKDKNINLY